MGERPKCAKEDVLALMDDERLRRLRSAADVGLLLYEDLDDYELPEGYDKDSVWKLLSAIRKQAAVFLPWFDPTDRPTAGSSPRLRLPSIRKCSRFAAKRATRSIGISTS